MPVNAPVASAPEANASPARRPFQFGLGALLIAMTVAGAVLGFMGILALRGIERSREMESMNNMKQMGIALHNYHDVLTRFPPPYSVDSAGKPLLSWRVYILPYIEQDNLYKQFHLNEPWDSPHNKTLIPLMPKIYQSPQTRSKKTLPVGHTCYLAVVGAETMFPPDRPQAVVAAPFGLPGGIRFAEVLDGLSNTIMVVEGAPERAVVWSKPDDWEFDEEKPTDGLLGQRADGFFALMGDGSLRRIPAQIHPENARRLFLRNDGNVIEMENLERPPAMRGER
jgi:hypothetical protein